MADAFDYLNRYLDPLTGSMLENRYAAATPLRPTEEREPQGGWGQDLMGMYDYFTNPNLYASDVLSGRIAKSAFEGPDAGMNIALGFAGGGLGTRAVGARARPGVAAEPYEAANVPQYAIPATSDAIDANQKVALPTLHRGTGADYGGNLRLSEGDIGTGVHLTPSEEIAKSYGGGPTASVSKGTRVVHSYEAQPLYPDEVVYVFGGKGRGEDVSLVSGTGIELWRGPYSSAAIEAELTKQGRGIKAVIGTPNSIGINQIAVRDPSILKRIERP